MLARFEQPADLNLDQDGAELFAQSLDEAALMRLEAALAALPTNVPGVRIGEGRQLKPFLEVAGPIGAIAATALGPDAHPVRVILFDKTAERNWALCWHQDRTIVVRERIGADGFGSLTVKSGLIQVEPPFDILERMVTLRVHLDEVDANNAPSRIVPGSHRLGRLHEAEVQRVVATSGERLCLAERGDVWLYATLSYTPRWLLSPRDAVACSRSIIRLMLRHTHSPGTASRWQIERPRPNGAVRL